MKKAVSNLERIAITDSKLLEDLKRYKDLPYVRRGACTDQQTSQEFLERAQASAQALSGRTHFNLTEEYRDAGGDTDKELLLVAEPKVSLDVNHLFRNPKREELLNQAIDYKRATNKVQTLDPDILLLNTRFSASIPEKLKEQYLQKEFEKNKNPIEVTLPHVLGGEVNIRFPRIEAKNLGDYEKIVSTNQYECYFGRDDLGKRSPLCHGGVILGERLSRQNTPYSFRVSNFGHNREDIKTAYTLDVLSEEDVGSLASDIYQNNPFPHHSKKGNIIESGLNLLKRAPDDSDASGNIIRPESVEALEKIIGVAREYQQ